MKSKLNDAELIAEAYAQVEPLEEGVAGALAAGAGAAARGLGTAARATGKALTSEPAKKIYKGAGKAVKKTAETVGGAAIGAVGGAAEGAAKAVGGVVQGAVEGTVGAVTGAVDGATGGLGKAAKGAVGMEDGEGKHDDGDNVPEKCDYVPCAEDGEHDAPEHDAPIEVDMSENPAPESLELSKEIEEPEVPASLAIVAPSIQPSIEGERVNHEDDSEMQMAKAELYKLEKYSFKLQQMLDHVPALEGWTASKITKAADYLSSVYHKLDYDLHGNEGGICSEDHEGH